MQHHARWRSIWFCPIPGCPCSLSSKEGLVRHLQSRQHVRGIEINLGRRVAKQIAYGSESVDQNQNLFQPPAAGLVTQHQDIYFIPPPRVVGGANGASTPVSTATLGLIHRHDPSLAAQLREDPGSLATRSTRLRVYSTMRLIRTGMLGQLASLQQWEEAMHAQDDK